MARGFEADEGPCDLMTAFEVFEHLENPLAELERMLVQAPWILVSTALVRTLFRDGVFFRRSAPDVYSAIALAANTKAFFASDELLTISGQGAKSNGAAYIAGKGEEFFSDIIALYAPRFPGRSIQMMILDSLLEVAEHFVRPDLLENVDFAENFLLALKQTRSNGMKVSSPEFPIILAASVKSGVGPKVFSELIHSFVSRVTSSTSVPLSTSNVTRTHLFEAADVLQLDGGVRGIYYASLAVSKALTNRSVVLG